MYFSTYILCEVVKIILPWEILSTHLPADQLTTKRYLNDAVENPFFFFFEKSCILVNLLDCRTCEIYPKVVTHSDLLMDYPIVHADVFRICKIYYKGVTLISPFCKEVRNAFTLSWFPFERMKSRTLALLFSVECVSKLFNIWTNFKRRNVKEGQWGHNHCLGLKCHLL